MDEGFIDLRQKHDAGMGSDSFWPSFTDIMMVVVMIFMIASTVLMLRNWELVEKLRATIEAEYAAMRERDVAENAGIVDKKFCGEIVSPV